MEAQPVGRSKGLDAEQLVGSEGFTRPKILEGARLAEYEPEQHRSIEVRNHLDAWSWSRTERLLVGLEAGGGKRRSLGFRVARRTSRGASASYGPPRTRPI